jgi:molybdopterin-biosynthesis enzyme MoeA-like protein
MNTPHFYAVIIGTEILNGRRADKHFEFVKAALKRLERELFASLVIKDDPVLIAATFELVRADPDGVMFSFGGIGSTPDDLTRDIAASVFTGKPTCRHSGFERDIVARFAEAAHPHRIHMADLPEGAGLLKNPVNNMSGFYLEDRYFFMPGFPEMSHPMVEEALARFFPESASRFRLTLLAMTSENTLIDVMHSLPETIEFSSLPMFVDGAPRVEISVAADNEAEATEAFGRFTGALDARDIPYETL